MYLYNEKSEIWILLDHFTLLSHLYEGLYEANIFPIF